MKKIIPVLMLALAAVSSCKKTSTTTNGTVDTAVLKPQFVVNGITDITLTSYTTFYTGMNISVQYMDSAQELVSLSFSGFPAGAAVDSTDATNLSGIPDFSSIIPIIDTGAKPGTYPITLTAVTPSGKKKTYSFNLNILPIPTAFFGKYHNCSFPCGGSTTHYADSIYADPAMFNKIWFANFNNTGSSVYGLITIDKLFEPLLTIPSQTIGGKTYSGSGEFTINGAAHGSILLNMHIDSVVCALYIR